MGGDSRQVGGDFLAKPLDPEGPPPAPTTLTRALSMSFYTPLFYCKSGLVQRILTKVQRHQIRA